MKVRYVLTGVVVLILIFLCAGSIASGYFAMRGLFDQGVRWGGLGSGSLTAEATEEKRLAVSGPADLTVDTPFGNIDVTTSDSPEIYVKMHKTAWGVSPQDAEARLKDLDVVITKDGNRVDIRVKTPVEVTYWRIGPSGGQVDFEIVVPVNCAVNAGSNSGRVSLAGTTGDAVLRSNFGDVRAENIRGSVQANSNSGKLLGRNITAGEAVIDFRTDFGDVELENVSGESIAAVTNSGRITVRKAAALEMITLQSSFGDVSVESGSAAILQARTNSGNVNLSAMTVKSDVTGHSDFGDVTCTGVTATNFMLDTNSGSIRFTGVLGAGHTFLKTNFGSIDIVLTGEQAFRLDLQTDLGSIHSSMEVTIQGSMSGMHWAGTAGDPGVDGPTLEAQTNSGDITIDKG